MEGAGTDQDAVMQGSEVVSEDEGRGTSMEGGEGGREEVGKGFGEILQIEALASPPANHRRARPPSLLYDTCFSLPEIAVGFLSSVATHPSRL